MGEGWIWHQKVDANFISSILLAILTFCISVQSVKLIGQYLLGKLIKPRRIPKLDFQNGVPKEYATFIVIPTILNQEKKVEEFFKKLEVFYLANKSENLYFALLGDCTSGTKQVEPIDTKIIQAGIREVEKLNQKYSEGEEKSSIFFIESVLGVMEKNAI